MKKISYIITSLVFFNFQSFASEVAVDDYEKLSSGQFKSYQIESQYGPKDSVLSPLFPRKGKFDLNLGLGYSTFSSLVDYFGYNVSLLYSVNRRHAIEPIWFQFNSVKLSKFAREEVRNKLTASKQGMLGVDFPKKMLASSYFFTPFYSKMQITSRSVLHYDTYMGLGLGAVWTEHNLFDKKKEAEEMRLGAALTLGLRMLIKDRFALRLELRDFIHSSKNIDAEEVFNTLQVGIAGTVYFGKAFPSYR